MKITRSVHHKVQPVQYESLDIGASVEADTEEEQFEGMDEEAIGSYLDTLLDDLLDETVNRALRLGGKMEESHLWDYYQKDT